VKDEPKTVSPSTPSQPPPSAPSQPPPAAPSQPPATHPLPISLWRGVALAQTGPEGTMMLFHVEYEFVNGDPSISYKYFWVIERAHGASIKFPRKLQAKGELQYPEHEYDRPLTGWRPEDGPFHTHIEDNSGKRLSDSIELL
jgi:hypothetical protein